MRAGRAPSELAPLLVLMLMTVVVTGVPATAANEDHSGLAVTVDRAHHPVLGADRFNFKTEITNHGASSTGPLVAHLNVASLQKGVYVDPEDWSPKRTQFIDPIAPGSSVKLEWTIQALLEGDFAVYVVVFPSDLSGPPVSSPSIDVHVGPRTILDLAGVLPVSIAAPVLLVVLYLVVRRWHRRHLDPGLDGMD